jgi:PAS domain S-box-containing protein
MGFHRFLGTGRLFIRTLVLLLAFGLPFAALAQPIAVHDLAVLVDADGSETIASVSAPEAAPRFTPVDGSLYAGHTRKVHWLRFSVQAPAAGLWWLEVMPPFLDDLRLFEPSGSGSFDERRSGDRLPFASREENYRGFVFKLALTDSAPHTFYLRLQTTSSSQLQLQLWQPAQFHDAQIVNYAVLGFYYGFLILLLLLNLIFWRWLREPLQGWFSLAVLANLYLFLGANGLAAQYVLPGSEVVTDLWGSSGILVFIAAVAPFYRRILGIGPEQKLFFAAFRVQVLLPCVLLLFFLRDDYIEAVRIAVAYSALAALLILYLAMLTWRKGQREALFVLLGSAMNLMAGAGSVLLLTGLAKGGVSAISSQQLMLLGSLMAMQAALAVRLQEASRVRRKTTQRAELAERDALHELHVHQIELEAQNEELRRTRDELDTSKARHFDFYDVAPVGYCTVSEKGLIKAVNLTTSTLLNVPRSQLIKQPIGNFIFHDDQGLYYQLRRKLKDTDKPLSCELRLLKQGGTPFWAHLDAMAAKDDDGANVLRLVLTDVSERKQAELVLAQSLSEKEAALERMQQAERFAQGTVDAISASLTILDANGVILDVNRTWRKIAQAHGLGSDNLCEGTNYLTVCDAASGASSDGAQEMAAGIRAVIQGHQNEFMLEYPCHSPTERRWFSSCVTRFEGTGGIRVVVAHEDISTRKLADMARDEAQATLQKIASRVPGMVYQYHLRLDGSSYFPYASEAIRDIYRISPQQAFQNASNLFAVIHPDDHDAKVIAIQQSAADITPWVQEYRVKFDDGTVRWLLGSSLPQRQPDGGTLWHGFITDITERRKMEAALAEKAQLLVTVLANSSVGIIFIRERKQVWSNARLCAMFGYTPAEFENQDPGLVYPSPQSEEKFVAAAYPALARDGHFSTSVEMQRKNGSLIWMSLSGTAIDRNNPHAGSIWVLQDISKQRQTEADLVVANDELTFQNEEKGKRAVELTTARDDAESANLAKSRFLATMSHEIRTPMNAVLGMAQVLMQANISEANRLDYGARTIFNSGQTLLALLNDILDLSKIEAGKVDLESIAIAPAQLIHETQTLFDQSARAKGLHIAAQWCGAERHYLGDPSRLRQMLSNLVGNAIKFTKQGSIRIEASEVACTAQSATLEFAVVDSGIGIPPDKLKLLFQTFSQADSSTTRNYGGTGLGLSIVRTLSQAMGGEAGVESEVGVGSRFWFRIQADLIAADVSTMPSQTEISASSLATQTPQLIGRVLVIEDNPINQEVMQVLLGQMGLEVALADDGQQGLDALMGGENAQLILTDLQMPVMDGYTAAQHIRQWEAQTQQKRRPIIAFSADAYASVRARCLEAGMDDVLSKPVLHSDLWSALAQWLPAVPLAPQSAPIPVVLKPVDPEAIIALINELLPMLARGKADAIDRFMALQELVAGSELAPEMADAGLPLKEFRFDLTRQRLLQMASKYEWRTAQ